MANPTPTREVVAQWAYRDREAEAKAPQQPLHTPGHACTPSTPTSLASSSNKYQGKTHRPDVIGAPRHACSRRQELSDRESARIVGCPPSARSRWAE